jgi:hypothetical protein
VLERLSHLNAYMGDQIFPVVTSDPQYINLQYGVLSRNANARVAIAYNVENHDWLSSVFSEHGLKSK